MWFGLSIARSSQDCSSPSNAHRAGIAGLLQPDGLGAILGTSSFSLPSPASVRTEPVEVVLKPPPDSYSTQTVDGGVLTQRISLPPGRLDLQRLQCAALA
jgi:hypothetical protein